MGILQIKKPFALRIKIALLPLFFAPLLSVAGVDDEGRSETLPVSDEISENRDVVSKKQVDDSAFVVPPPKIQIPVFEKGKWKGYREEPVPLARALSSDPESNQSMENLDTLSPVRRPSEQASSVN